MKQQIKDNSIDKMLDEKFYELLDKENDILRLSALSSNGDEKFTGGEWYIENKHSGIAIWVDTPDKSTKRQIIASTYGNEANAALISQAKNMYYALKEIRNWYEQNAHRIAPDTPICFSEALSILQKANPK